MPSLLTRTRSFWRRIRALATKEQSIAAVILVPLVVYLGICTRVALKAGAYRPCREGDLHDCMAQCVAPVS